MGVHVGNILPLPSIKLHAPQCHTSICVQSLLLQVEVTHTKLQKTFIFPCNAWLKKDGARGLDGCKVDLTTGIMPVDVL